VLSTVDMVVQRRDGPRRLRDDDDDYDAACLAGLNWDLLVITLELYRRFASWSARRFCSKVLTPDAVTERQRCPLSVRGTNLLVIESTPIFINK